MPGARECGALIAGSKSRTRGHCAILRLAPSDGEHGSGVESSACPGRGHLPGSAAV